MRRIARLMVAALLVSGCAASADSDPAGNDSSTDLATADLAADDLAADDLAASIVPAMLAVEAELGPQEYFEVTSNEQVVNLFVAVDDASAAVPYVWIDGELQAPAPRQDGAAGLTFRLDDVEIDRAAIQARLDEDLPNTTINAFSVYGDGFGATYVLAARSEAGGLLDVVITGDGTIVSVDPI